MSRYYMFIPFSKSSKKSDYGPDSNRITKFSSKSMTPVYCSEGGKPFTDGVLGDSTDVVIYIRGHGSSGSGQISSLKSKGEKVDAVTVVGMLIAKGLEVKFSGRIKCYNCHSAEPVDGSIGFAAQVDACLRKEKYESVRVYGYAAEIGGVTQSYGKTKGGQKAAKRLKRMENTNEDGSKSEKIEELKEQMEDQHRWVVIQNQRNGKKRDKPMTGRASDIRYKIENGKAVFNSLHMDKPVTDSEKG